MVNTCKCTISDNHHVLLYVAHMSLIFPISRLYSIIPAVRPSRWWWWPGKTSSWSIRPLVRQQSHESGNGGRFRWKNGGLRWDFLVVSTVDHGWLVVWNMAFMTFHILGRIIPTDFHIFQRGWNHQPDDKLSSEHQVQDFRACYWSWLGDIPGLLRTRGKCIIQERFQIDGMWVRHFCPNCLEVTQTGVCCPDFFVLWHTAWNGLNRFLMF